MARPVSAKKLQQMYDRYDAAESLTILTTCPRCRGRKPARQSYCPACAAWYEERLGHTVS